MQRRPLSGTYECSLDSRFRMAIPARVREPFADGATVGWWIDECLIIAPESEWSSLVDRTFGTMNVLDDESRELSRFLLAGVYNHDLDGQGRVPLAQDLREHAGIEGNKVKVIGVGEYLEVWDPDKLAARFARLRQEGVSARAQRLADRIA
jgi:MraZ protein